MPPAFLLAITFLAPQEIQQGQVLRLTAPQAEPGLIAFFAGKDFPIFATNGRSLALIPVGVYQQPGAFPITIKGPNGDVLQQLPVIVKATDFPTQNIVATRQMKELKPLPGEVERMRSLAATVSKDRHFEDAFVLPVRGCRNSPFGVQRLHNGKPSGNYHRGVDQRGPEGTPIQAAASGLVAVAQPNFQLHGGTVGLDHGQGLTSHYLHMSKVAVREGQRVNQGDVIGYVGSTGFATGPHLHWGVNLHATPVNPTEFVKLTPCSAAKSPPAKRTRPPKKKPTP
ncbi:MAG: M23 family metallopeptidase [Bryobacterales bacterium]|nr:M23 family metallopeptidase [Bryobacterales bacterium]